MRLYRCNLHNSQPGHDKVYVVDVDRMFAETPEPRHALTVYWGRRGATNLQKQAKGSFTRLTAALLSADDLIRSKLDKGYRVVSVSADPEAKQSGALPHISFVDLPDNPDRSKPSFATMPQPIKTEKPATPDREKRRPKMDPDPMPTPGARKLRL